MPKVAIVGAGLTGLFPAYLLRDTAKVVIFEKTNRIGGRISSSSTPQGEHGAEFFLGGKSEPVIHKIMKVLQIKKKRETSDWPGYFFNGRIASGSPEHAAQKLLSPNSAGFVSQFCQMAKSRSYPKTKIPFDQCLSQSLKFDNQSIAFIDMILKGETCAPLGHITVKYALGCLSSMYDSWFRIEQGSQSLAMALLKESKATVRRNSWVNAVKQSKTGIQVKGLERGKRFSNKFNAVVITTPEGEGLVGKSTHRHFHGYISILFQYPFRPQLKSTPKFNLERGLYTDSFFNYLQVRHIPKKTYVLRVLVPDVEAPAHPNQQKIVKNCVEYLDVVLQKAYKFSSFSVKYWEAGLPCGGSAGTKCYRLVSPGILICGDRFGEWPSMEAALSSGAQAAKVLQRFFKV